MAIGRHGLLSYGSYRQGYCPAGHSTPTVEMHVLARFNARRPPSERLGPCRACLGGIIAHVYGAEHADGTEVLHPPSGRLSGDWHLGRVVDMYMLVDMVGKIVQCV